MKNLVCSTLFLMPFLINAQTYEVTTKTRSSNYSAYTGQGQSTSTSTVKQVKSAADYIRESSDNMVNAIQASSERRSIRQAAEIQARAIENAAKSIIDNQNRIEEERKLEQKKIEQEKLIKEKDEYDNNNYYNSSELRTSNLEDLTTRLIQIERSLNQINDREKTKKKQIKKK